MSIRAPSRQSFLVLCLLLGGCSSDVTANAIGQLESPNVEVRRSGVRAMGERAALDARAVTALTNAVGDRDTEVRWLAVDALGRGGSAAASSLPALIKALDDTDSTVRLKAALAVQNIDPKNSSVVPVLTREMLAGNGRVLLEVGRRGSDAAWAVPTLVGLLSHESPKLRALAAQTLGGIGPAAVGAKPALQRATGDSSAAVQSAARDSLSRIDGKHADVGMQTPQR
jgi:HEAT repeat protein